MGKVCVFLGTGFEEVEALTVVDLLRRADIDTATVSIMEDKTVLGSHGIPVVADELISELDFGQVDMIVMPGGVAGTRNLEECEKLMEQLDAFASAEKPVGAVCAAPSILGHRGILKGKRAICYPTFESHLDGAQVVRQPAVTDGNIITGRGMGCSVDFGLAIVEFLKGKDAKEELAEKIVFRQ